jgi:hypothetical protein
MSTICYNRIISVIYIFKNKKGVKGLITRNNREANKYLPFSSSLHLQSTPNTSFTTLRILCAGCPGLILISNLELLSFLVDSLYTVPELQ